MATDDQGNLGPITIISADGVAIGHLTENDMLVIDELLPEEENIEYCQAQTYHQTLETPAEYCENEMPCPIHRDQEEDDYYGDDER